MHRFPTCKDAWQVPDRPGRDAWLDYWSPLLERIETDWNDQGLVAQVRRPIPSRYDSVQDWLRQGGLPEALVGEWKADLTDIRVQPGLNFCFLIGLGTLELSTSPSGRTKRDATVYLGRRPFMAWKPPYRQAREGFRTRDGVNLYEPSRLERMTEEHGPATWCVPQISSGGALHLLVCEDGVYGVLFRRKAPDQFPERYVQERDKLQQSAGFSHLPASMLSYDDAAREEALEELVILDRSRPRRYFLDFSTGGGTPREPVTPQYYALAALRYYYSALGFAGEEAVKHAHPLPARLLSVGEDTLTVVGPDGLARESDPGCLIAVSRTATGFDLLKVCIVDCTAEGLSSEDLLLLDGEMLWERSDSYPINRPVYMIPWQDFHQLARAEDVQSATVFRWVPAREWRSDGSRPPWKVTMGETVHSHRLLGGVRRMFQWIDEVGGLRLT